ncbi:hypothetical protein MMC13_002101 [Lambiella insularis]|nr:hypothetical protein [Lambiella insularis]
MTSVRMSPLLSHCFALPPSPSLVLLIRALGATTNWLTLRYATVARASGLRDSEPRAEAGTEGDRGNSSIGQDEVGVVLVSFLSDWNSDLLLRQSWDIAKQERTQWRIVLELEVRRFEDIANVYGRKGVDFARGARSHRFAFVDGLSELFLASSTDESKVDNASIVLRDAALTNVKKVILDAIEHVRHQGKPQGERRVVLVVDGLDVYLASTAQLMLAVDDILGEWRQVRRALLTDSLPIKHTYTTVVTASADAALMQYSGTRLETQHTALVASLAHEANLVIGVRGLESGVAKDVSGIIRISRGGMVGWWQAQGEKGTTTGEEVEGKEMLFFRNGDGAIKAWERGN